MVFQSQIPVPHYDAMADTILLILAMQMLLRILMPCVLCHSIEIGIAAEMQMRINYFFHFSSPRSLEKSGKIKATLNPNPESASYLAGAEGLEPSTTVLETAMLPLHHAPRQH